MEEKRHLMDLRMNSSSPFPENILSVEIPETQFTLETNHKIVNDISLPITVCESNAQNCNKSPFFISPQSISSSCITPSTVIIVSGSNFSQLQAQSTPVIDVTFLSSSLSSSLNSTVSLIYQSPTSSTSSPFLFSSITSGLPESLVPSSPLNLSSSLASSSLSSSSLVDLQPLSMMSYQKICFHEGNQANGSISYLTSTTLASSSSTPMLLSSSSLSSQDQSSLSKDNIQKTTNPSILSTTSLQKVRCSETYDFSPSKESPIKPLKILRRRPPPPPIGSYRNRNYFSKLPNLRKTVLEKSLLGKSTKNSKESKTNFKSYLILFENSESLKNSSKTDIDNKVCNVRSENLVNTDAVKCISVRDSSIHSIDKIKATFEKISLPSSDNLSVSSEDMINEDKINSCVEFSKRKRGRPRKNDAQSPKTSHVLTKELSNNIIHKRRYNTIVTRHSTFRKEDDCEMKISSQRKRARRQKIFMSENKSSKKELLHDNISLQHHVSCNDTHTVFRMNRGKKNKEIMESSAQCFAIYQGGFKRSKEFLDSYVKSSCKMDILFPHITEEDVCIFKLANQFYKEHKDETYNIFGQDEDFDDAILKHCLIVQNDDTHFPTQQINFRNSVLDANTKSEEFSGNQKTITKSETSEVQFKRGRGRPRINRDLQVMPESERKKKKLISSILRELGDQEDAKKLSSNQSIEIADNQNDRPPNENEREIGSVVTFITPHKRLRSDVVEIESMSLKKTEREQNKLTPSLFLSFGNETSACKNNFITFESLIPHTLSPSCTLSSLTSSSVPYSNNLTPLEKQSGNIETNTTNRQPSPFNNKLAINKKQFMHDGPKCTCMHQCGLKDTYLSTPFKRPSSQTPISTLAHTDSQSDIIMLGHQPTPIPQSFVFPFTSGSFQSLDLHKHIFPGTTEEKQHSQPFTLLCHHDNSNPLYSLVMTSGGLGCYSMATDDKIQLQPMNKLGQIVIPYVINNFTAVKSAENKSDPKVTVEPDKIISPPSPLQAPPHLIPYSRHLFADVQEPRQDISCNPGSATLTKSYEAGKILEQSDNQTNDESHIPINATNLSKSLSYLRNQSPSHNSQHCEQVGRNTIFNKCLKMANNTSMNLYSNNNGGLNVFNDGNSGNRYAYYNDCPPAKYFLQSHNLNDQSLYDNHRLMFSHVQAQISQHGSTSYAMTRQNQNYNSLLGPQFSYSCMEGSTSFENHDQNFFDCVNIPGQSKAINNNQNNF